MRLFSLALVGALLTPAVSPSSAQPSTAEWQKTLIGVPSLQLPASGPKFHRLPLRDGKALTFLLAITTKNVLAALDPVGGSVAWRQVHDQADPPLIFRPNQDGVFVISGGEVVTVRLLEVKTGNIIWETSIPPSMAYTPETELGVDMVFATDQTVDVFVLVHGRSICRLDGLSGETKWRWETADETSLTTLKATPSTIYAVGMAQNVKPCALHVITVDTSTGASIASLSIPADVSSVSRNILLLARDTTSTPTLVWVQSNSMKAMQLSSSLTSSPTTIIGPFTEILDVQLSHHGYFVGLRANNTASVFRAGIKQNGIEHLWEFANSASAISHSESTFSGGFDKEGRPYVTRMYWSAFFKACSMELFAPHGADGKGAVGGHNFAFNTNQHGVILHAAVEVANPREMLHISRFAVTTSTGTLQTWQQEKLLWTRDESLAYIKAAAFVDLPQRWMGDLYRSDGNPGFRGRLAQLSRLGSLAARFNKHSTLPSLPSNTAYTPLSILWRDTFGFRKLIIVATLFGKVMAIDSATGELSWSQLLSLGETSGRPMILDLHLSVIHGRNQPRRQRPEAVLVVTSVANQTYIYHFDALTGTPIGTRRSQGMAPVQYQVNRTVVATTTPDVGLGAVAVIDDTLLVHVYPPGVAEDTHTMFSGYHFARAVPEAGVQRLSGYKITSRVDEAQSRVLQALPIWSTIIPQGCSVDAIVKANPGPTASFGKVLGNRTTLYKYLNPHLTAITTSSQSRSSRECSVILLDAVKGTVYHQTSFRSSQSCDVKMVLSGHAFFFSYFDGDCDNETSSKGHKIVSVELFEGAADESTSSPHSSSFSQDGMRITVHHQSFVYPHAVQAIGVTSTKFGIALRDILIATDQSQIHALSTRLLDPRRPVGIPTTDHQTEGLVPFDPVLPYDAKRILSHHYPVTGVQSIITSPSQLESTSILFAHGLDLFLTRVAPSNTFDVLSEDFNRLQLIVTTAGLAAAILITKPLVRGRLLKAQWYS